MKTLALSLVVLALAQTARAASVIVERPEGKICYRLQAQTLCVHDEDAPGGVSYTNDNTAKPAKWDYLAKNKLDGALTRDALSGKRFDDAAGFASAMGAINKKVLTGPVTIEKPAGKICYRYQKQTLCLHDEDAPANVSYTNDNTAKPAQWDNIQARKLELPLTRQTLGQNKLETVEGFLGAMAIINAKAMFKPGAAMESLEPRKGSTF